MVILETRNSCAQLGAPTGSVPNLNHHSIALELARCAHFRFDLCARIEIFGFVSAQSRLWLDHLQTFPPNLPSFFSCGLIGLPSAYTTPEPFIQFTEQPRKYTYLPTYLYVQTCQNPYMVQTGNTSEMPRWGEKTCFCGGRKQFEYFFNRVENVL